MANDIGARIGLDGLASFEQASKLAVQQMKSLETQFRATMAQFDKGDKSQAALTKQNEALSRQLQQATERTKLYGAELNRQNTNLDKAAAAVAKANAEYGEGSTQAQKAQREYASLAIEVAKIEQRYNSASEDVSTMTREIESNENAIRDIERGYNDAGKEVDEFGNTVDYVKPELFVLIPVLYGIGLAIKQSERIKDNHIPLLLGLFGALLAALWVLGSVDIASYKDALMALFTAIVQGILCATGAVYANQVWKQAKKDE